MSKKEDLYYFQSFVQGAEASCQAAELLNKVVTDFHPADIQKHLDEIHQIEHQGDGVRHQVMDKLAKAFIVPLEREDISSLCDNIDEVTDKLEDVLIRLYINNVSEIRPDVPKTAEVVVQCCQEMKALLQDFTDFRHSKTIKNRIIKINELEETADRLYVECMRRLHVEEKDAIKIIAWREIYNYLEKCADACEHVADVVESVIMKNS